MLSFSAVGQNYVKVDGDKQLLRAFQDEFTFVSMDEQTLAVAKAVAIKRGVKQAKHWDGKKKLFNLRTKLMGAGLFERAIRWAVDNDIPYDVDATLDQRQSDITSEEAFKLLTSRVPIKEIKRLRDYQLKGVVIGLKKKRALLVSPTGSGKSLMMYCLWRTINKKTLIIVPTITLVKQLLLDFAEYTGVTEEVMRQYVFPVNSEEDVVDFNTVFVGDCVIGTWQSIVKFPPEILASFQCVIGDEAHGAEAASIQAILDRCTEAEYCIGTTGTVKPEKVHIMNLEASFGGIYQLEKTANLIERGMLTPIEIKVIVLKYHPDDVAYLNSEKLTAKRENDFIEQHYARNWFIANLGISSPENCLTLFKRRAHGHEVARIARELSTKTTFHVDGLVKGDVRNEYRLEADKHSDLNYICSIATWATGINMPNLHRLILGASMKGLVRLLQSFGRTIRLYPGKKVALAIDIADDITSDKYPEPNYTLKHLRHRLEIYGEEQFPYSIETVNLPRMSPQLQLS